VTRHTCTHVSPRCRRCVAAHARRAAWPVGARSRVWRAEPEDTLPVRHGARDKHAHPERDAIQTCILSSPSCALHTRSHAARAHSALCVHSSVSLCVRSPHADARLLHSPPHTIDTSISHHETTSTPFDTSAAPLTILRCVGSTPGSTRCLRLGRGAPVVENVSPSTMCVESEQSTIKLGCLGVPARRTRGPCKRASAAWWRPPHHEWNWSRAAHDRLGNPSRRVALHKLAGSGGMPSLTLTQSGTATVPAAR